MKLTPAERDTLRECLLVAAGYLRHLASRDGLHMVTSVALGDTLRKYADNADAVRQKIETL